MTINFPGPCVVTIYYTVDGVEHTINLNCVSTVDVLPGTVPALIDLVQRNSGNVNLSVAVNAFCDVLAPLMDTGTSFTRYEFFNVAPLSTEKTFVTQETLVVLGTNVTPYNPGWAGTFSFRTQEGGHMKVVLGEITGSLIGKYQYGDLSVAGKAVVDYIDSGTNWILARDTSYPFGLSHYTLNFNRKLTDKRFNLS